MGKIGKINTGGLEEYTIAKRDSLIARYKEIQSSINAGGSDPFVAKLKTVVAKALKEKFTLENSTFMPEDIKTKSGGSCIGTACYFATQAGENFKFFSNSLAQDNAKTASSTRYLEPSNKYIQPSDILQFKTNAKGRPYHAFTVMDIKNLDNGTKEIKVAGSPGHGAVIEKSYYLGKDNLIYSDPGLVSKYSTQLLKRKNPITGLNDLIKDREALKAQITDLDPTYFNPTKTIRSNDYHPTSFVLNDTGENSTTSQGRKVILVDNGVDDSSNKKNPTILLQNKSKYDDISESRLPDILSKYSDPEYKKKFMSTYNVSNREYDSLVENMVGIYGAETKFNSDYLGKTKKVLGVNVPAPEWGLLHNLIGNKENHSIGPFQVTYNQLPEEYKKSITVEDLSDPIKASEAAMVHLASGLTTLRKRASDKKEDPTYTENINTDNYLEYLPYVYNQPSWLSGDASTKKKYNDVVSGNSSYKKQVDFYKKQAISSIPLSVENPVEVTSTKLNK